VRALRIVLTIVLFGASAFVIGSGLAAIPYGENDPCIGGYETLDTDWAIQLVPYGTRCEYETPSGRTDVRELSPSVGVAVAWWVASALVLVGVLRFRRYASVRGTGLALGVLGAFGLAWHQSEFIGAVILPVVLGLPLWCVAAWLLQPGRSWGTPIVLSIALPFTVLFAWTLLGFSGWPEAGVLFGLLAGAGVATVAERVTPTFDQWLPASPPPRG
jgi:hypothetical protein